MPIKTTPPGHGERVFTCGHCGQLTEHFWYLTLLGQSPGYANNSGRPVCQFNEHEVAQCAHCNKPTLFVQHKLVYPLTGIAPSPAHGMPEETLTIYREASGVVGISPRAACALLRLAADDLTKTYGAAGNDFNARVADLVKKGAASHIQQAFDIARVHGNELVHEAQIRAGDSLETAMLLFQCVNWIVEWHEGTKQLDGAFAKLPEEKRKAISRRDRPGP